MYIPERFINEECNMTKPEIAEMLQRLPMDSCLLLGPIYHQLIYLTLIVFPGRSICTDNITVVYLSQFIQQLFDFVVLHYELCTEMSVIKLSDNSSRKKGY